MTALDLSQKLKAHFGTLISDPSEFRGEITIQIAESRRIAEPLAPVQVSVLGAPVTVSVIRLPEVSKFNA